VTSIRYTSSDLELLPDIDGVRYEIIDGDLYVTRQLHFAHQHAGGVVYAELLSWGKKTRLGTPILAPGLIFAPDDDVAPDLVWISNARLAHALDDAGHLRAAPELVVEVLSAGTANERRDRELKLKLYSRQGVGEYWIVDWRLQLVQVYRRQDAALHLVATLNNDDPLESPLLPDFSCPVRKLWMPALP
jgi:Uma2 family endonuclease